MPRIVFVHPDGARSIVEAEVGVSIMSAAVSHGIPEVVAECGGACACGTCHCCFDAEWRSKLVPPSDMELAMIECVMNPSERSRLTCQVEITEELDGVVVHLPASQY